MPSEPDPEAQAVALELVQEIERIEGTAVNALDAGSADAYIAALATFIGKRFKEDVGIDLPRGQWLLENLREAYSFGPNLQEANLQEANLRGANLQGADLQEHDLRGANLQGANLQEARLIEAWLEGANLEGANLQEALLLGARLQGADLQRAYLESAHVRRADLRGADLRFAILSHADLQEANLHRANLQDAWSLTQGQLEQANGDESTKLPEELTRPASWFGSSEDRAYIRE